MAENIDQVFVSLKSWVLAQCPATARTFAGAILSIAALIGVFAALFALTTVLERKGLGRIQNRYGPNRVGPFGLLQPIADGIKTLTKEDIVPSSADFVVHFLAPLALVVPTFLSLAVIPMGRNMVAANLDAGLLFFFAVGAASELAVFMAGWSSRNKYSLLGAMRAIAQMVSYEVPLILAAVPVIMTAGSLSTVQIVEQQSGAHGLLDWYFFTPWGLTGFLLFMVAGAAECNRSPFDLPEGESEIIAGYYTEYSGFKFALFFLAEYIGMFAVSGVAITLFLGGWHAPAAWMEWIPSWFWFFVKLLALVAVFIWVRGTLPRLRIDQLMNFAWKFMLPLGLTNLAVAGLWNWLPLGLSRWVVCIAIIAAAYSLLGIRFKPRARKRAYRFAE